MARLLRLARYVAIRIATSTELRRLVPPGPAFALIEIYARASARLRTRAWREAEAFERALYGKSALAGRERELATRFLAERWKNIELFWRPWTITGAAIDGLEVVDAARAAGRRVLITFPHFAMAYAIPASVHRFGEPISIVAAPFHYTNRERSYRGRHASQGYAYINASGRDLGVPRPGTFEICRERLLRGEAVVIAFDVVGSLPTRFLGRTVALASGPARLAVDTDAVVVPVIALRRGGRVVVTFDAAIDVRDHAGVDAVQAAIAAVMERWALQTPESVWPLDDQPGGAPLIKDEPVADAV